MTSPVGQIWIIGGTSESTAIAQACQQALLPSVVTMTTPSARGLYRMADSHPGLHLWVGRLTPDLIPRFLAEHRVAGIIDASHPFAVAISELAIATARAHQLPYLRYERPRVASSPTPYLDTVASAAELVQGDRLWGERVLLTLGYRWLPEFAALQPHCQLFSRILPSPIALHTALASGFTSDRLIALRPPISPELERALWQQWHITTVVTKASGKAGGEDVKQAIAQELQVKLIVIERPTLAYPQVTDQIEVVVDKGRSWLRI